MKTLTDRQEIFAEAVAGGACQLEAYRLAFPAANSCKPESVGNKASALAKNDDVSARIETLKEKMGEQALWKMQQSIAKLAAIATDESLSGGERVAAIKVLNVMYGYDVPKKINDSSLNSSMVQEQCDVTKLSESAMAEILAAKVGHV